MAGMLRCIFEVFAIAEPAWFGDSYRDSARETASAASDAAMKSRSGRFGNGANPKL